MWVTQHVFDQIHPTFTLTDPGSVSTDFCYDLFGIPLFMPDNCLKVLSQFKYYILPLHTRIQNFFSKRGGGGLFEFARGGGEGPRHIFGNFIM